MSLPDDQAISEAKLSASELRARLWDEGLIAAELPNGKPADVYNVRVLTGSILYRLSVCVGMRTI